MRTTATAPCAATETTVADEVTTSASGAYNLSLDPGDYVVCEVSKAAPPLWQQSQPANTACEAIDGLEPGGHAVSVQSGQQLDEGNFGNWRQGNKPGLKFNDLNRDGDRDLGEDGLEGWTIRAYEDDGDGTLRGHRDHRRRRGHHLGQRRLQPQPRPRRLRRLRGLQGRAAALAAIAAGQHGLRGDRRPRARRPRGLGPKRPAARRGQLRQLAPGRRAGLQIQRPKPRRRPRPRRGRARGLDDPRL